MSVRPVLLLLVLAPLALSGCVRDYAQRTDRIAFHSGNAVRANLEGQTINPSKRSMYVTTGLGQNGNLANTDVAAPAP